MVSKTPEEVTSTLRDLDNIQFNVFEKLDSILDIQLSQGTENVTVELVRSQIAKEVTGLISKFEELVMLLDIQTKNYPKRHDLSLFVDIYKGKSSQLKHQLREAQIKSYTLEEELIHKQRVEKFGTVPERAKSIKEMRQELFSGRSLEEEKKWQEGKNEDQILEQNKSITASLQSTRQLMTSSIIQTDLNADSIQQQTKDLNTFDNLLSELENTLKKSRNIVKFIEKQDRSDKNRIYMALGFFFLCCIWVIWRRILKTPVKIVLWSFFKVFRIVLWFFPKSKEKDIIDSVVSSSGIIATMAATTAVILQETTSTTTPSSILSESFVLEHEDGDSKVRTWDQVLEDTYVRDEL